MINLFDLKIDTQLFDKFIFHNGQPECMNVKLFNELINYQEHIDYDDGKIHIWYVRNDDGLPDFIYNNDEEKIKKVLPNLLPELNYDDLEVSSGTDAMVAFAKMLDTDDQKEVIQIRKDMLDYCRLDTLAMVKIFEKMRKIY